MGREVKRVALDFEWELWEVWPPYICPFNHLEYAKYEKLFDWWYSEARADPPSGDGYQLWETVSEGSPVSPVFASWEDFANYLITIGHSPASAIRLIDDGVSMSMVFDLSSGVVEVNGVEQEGNDASNR